MRPGKYATTCAYAQRKQVIQNLQDRGVRLGQATKQLTTHTHTHTHTHMYTHLGLEVNTQRRVCVFFYFRDSARVVWSVVFHNPLCTAHRNSVEKYCALDWLRSLVLQFRHKCESGRPARRLWACSDDIVTSRTARPKLVLYSRDCSWPRLPEILMRATPKKGKFSLVCEIL
jgi:hypothetical protein